MQSPYAMLSVEEVLRQHSTRRVAKHETLDADMRCAMTLCRLACVPLHADQITPALPLQAAQGAARQAACGRGAACGEPARGLGGVGAP